MPGQRQFGRQWLLGRIGCRPLARLGLLGGDTAGGRSPPRKPAVRLAIAIGQRWCIRWFPRGVLSSGLSRVDQEARLIRCVASAAPAPLCLPGLPVRESPLASAFNTSRAARSPMASRTCSTRAVRTDGLGKLARSRPTGRPAGRRRWRRPSRPARRRARRPCRVSRVRAGSFAGACPSACPRRGTTCARGRCRPPPAAGRPATATSLRPRWAA